MRERILEVIGEFLPLEENIVLEDDTLLEDYGLDSLLFIEIVVSLENVFDVEVPDEYLVIAELDTIGKMMALLNVLKAENNEKNVEMERCVEELKTITEATDEEIVEESAKTGEYV